MDLPLSFWKRCVQGDVETLFFSNTRSLIDGKHLSHLPQRNEWDTFSKGEDFFFVCLLFSDNMTSISSFSLLHLYRNHLLVLASHRLSISPQICLHFLVPGGSTCSCHHVATGVRVLFLFFFYKSACVCLGLRELQACHCGLQSSSAVLTTWEIQGAPEDPPSSPCDNQRPSGCSLRHYNFLDCFAV